MKKQRSCRLRPSGSRFAVVVVLLCAPGIRAHHEAIFGPQSSVLISRQRFVSAQYYLTNQGRSPEPRRHSHIGVLSVGTALAERWSLTATLPLEAERGDPHERATGLQDLVIGVRYSPDAGHNRRATAVFTVEPPTGTLEHRAVGFGGGLVYAAEQGHWSGIAYGLGRTESSLEEGERRGNRVFLGGGVAYETHLVPLSPQLGLSWERTTRRLEHGDPVEGSNTSALMLHPTLATTFSEAFQVFLVVSLPVAQRSGPEGWQNIRAAAGMIWSF
jgi:hypothetical protein